MLMRWRHRRCRRRGWWRRRWWRPEGTLHNLLCVCLARWIAIVPRHALSKRGCTILQIAHVDVIAAAGRGAEELVAVRWRIELAKVLLADCPCWLAICFASAAQGVSGRHERGWWRRPRRGHAGHAGPNVLRDGVLAVVIGDGYAGCGCWTRGGRAPPARARDVRARAQRERSQRSAGFPPSTNTMYVIFWGWGRLKCRAQRLVFTFYRLINK